MSKPQKTLLLVRHGKTKDHADFEHDAQRTLTDRGEKNSRDTALIIRGLDVIPEMVRCSTAQRAVQTAKLMMKTWKTSEIDLRLEEDLYLPTAEHLFYQILQSPDEVSRLMFVGHEPSLSQVTRAFVPHFSGKVVTASVSIITFRAEKWSDIHSRNILWAKHYNRHYPGGIVLV
ncbi:MAG: hypothetical protein Kow0075_16000 [Salibacteraceae bacterium]